MRQLRIDEDVLGFSDEQLTALTWLGQKALCSPTLKVEDRERISERLGMFDAEKRRRARL